MISIVMLVIMAGCAAYLFLKGTLALGIAMVFNALIGGFVAFGFFELLATYLVKYSPGIAAWAPMICFLLLFVLVFAILQAAAMQINKEKIDFGKLPEQIGRPVAGVLLGYIVTGCLLVALAMAPLPSQYPYARFEGNNPNPANPNKALLSPDGFVTGLFSTVSAGSFSPMGEPKSFAILHAGFLDQLYLNRHGKDVTLKTDTQAIDVPGKDGVWEAPENLRDSENKPVSSQPGKNLMLVRMEVRKGALKDAAKFTLSQVRLACGGLSHRIHWLRRPAGDQTARRGHQHRSEDRPRQSDDGSGVSGPDDPDAGADRVQEEQRAEGVVAGRGRRRPAARALRLPCPAASDGAAG